MQGRRARGGGEPGAEAEGERLSAAPVALAPAGSDGELLPEGERGGECEADGDSDCDGDAAAAREGAAPPVPRGGGRSGGGPLAEKEAEGEGVPQKAGDAVPGSAEALSSRAP